MDWVWATLPLVADMVNLKVVFEWGLGQEKNPLPTLPSPPSLLTLLPPWRDQICLRKWKLESLNLQIYNLMVSFLNKLHGSFEGEFWSPLSKSTFEETFLQAIGLAFQLYYFCCVGIFFLVRIYVLVHCINLRKWWKKDSRFRRRTPISVGKYIYFFTYIVTCIEQIQF